MNTLLREAREKKGLTTRDVARLLDIDQALVSKFETGHRTPTRAQIQQLAELLGIDFNEILVLWLKQKLLQIVANEPLAAPALQAALQEIQPQPAKPDAASLQKLLDEMDALKQKFENLR